MTMKKAIEILGSCDGNCKSCKHWRMKFSEVNDHLTVYAHYCDIASKSGCVLYGERLATLREETLRCLLSEIKYTQRTFK